MKNYSSGQVRSCSLLFPLRDLIAKRIASSFKKYMVLWGVLALLASSIQVLGQQSLVKLYYDSAEYYLEFGKTWKARACMDKVRILKVVEKDEGRSYLLLARINKEEGYIVESLSNYRQARQLARKRNNKIMEAIAANGIASRLIYFSEFDSALWYCEESMRLDSGLKNELENRMIMGQYCENKMQYDKAWSQYQYVHDKAKDLQNNLLLSRALTGMHNVYLIQYKDIDRALDYQLQALSVLDSSKHANRMTLLYTSIASGYLTPGYRNNSKENHKLAKLYLDRAKTINDLTGNLYSKGYLVQHIAALKETQGDDLREIIPYYEEALTINRGLGQKRELKFHLLSVGYMYIQSKQYNKARKLLMEGLSLSKELKDLIYLNDYYETIATLDSLTGNYANAYANLKRAMIFKDSTYSTNKIKAVEEIQAKYENEQKEKTIAEKELIIHQQKYQQAVTISIAVIFLLAVVTILLWVWNRQKTAFQKERERQSYLRLQAIVNTQEEVQQTIARDIHDGLVQVLGAAKMSLQAININGDKHVIYERIKNASTIMDEACTEARNISHQILPYSLMKDGLLPALEELLKRSLTDVKYEFDFTELENRLNKDIEINIYRIAQELIQNIVKHGMATHVNIRLCVQENNLKLFIEDNGKGFDPTSTNGSVGLTNIKTRAQLIGGTFTLNSKQTMGTKAMIEIPIPEYARSYVTQVS